MVSGVRRSCANAAFRRLRSSAVRHKARCDAASEVRIASNDAASLPNSSERPYDTEKSRSWSAIFAAAASSVEKPGASRMR